MKILIVDDDQVFVRALGRFLQQDGYEICSAISGLEGVRWAESFSPDLIILDVRMPDIDGREACKRLREVCRVPIMFLSALSAEVDVVRGFCAGGDDYLPKPVRMSELLARIRALLRRSMSGKMAPLERYDDGVLSIDAASQYVEKRGVRLQLSRSEYKLLATLLLQRGRIVSQEELLRTVWGEESVGDPQQLVVSMRYLRRKIEDDPHHPRYLRTRHGHGYWFSGPDDVEPLSTSPASLAVKPNNLSEGPSALSLFSAKP
jgi:DNA-binding response OmpR family regulator